MTPSEWSLRSPMLWPLIEACSAGVSPNQAEKKRWIPVARTNCGWIPRISSSRERGTTVNTLFWATDNRRTMQARIGVRLIHEARSRDGSPSAVQLT